MILIDKLCYQSKLRYVNAAEKSAYAMLTLLMCVVSRSPVVAAAAFAVNGLLTVGAGKIPLSRYLRLLLIPAAFLLLGTGALVLNLSGEPMDAFAVSVGNWYITGSREALGQAARLCATAFAAVSCLYFLALNTTMTDIMGVLAKLHLPLFFYRTDAADLPVYLCPAGDGVLYPDSAGIPPWQPGPADVGTLLRRNGLRTLSSCSEAVERSV